MAPFQAPPPPPPPPGAAGAAGAPGAAAAAAPPPPPPPPPRGQKEDVAARAAEQRRAERREAQVRAQMAGVRLCHRRLVGTSVWFKAAKVRGRVRCQFHNHIGVAFFIR